MTDTAMNVVREHHEDFVDSEKVRLLAEFEEQKAEMLVSHGKTEQLDAMEDLEQKKKFAERLRMQGVWGKGYKKRKDSDFQGTLETLCESSSIVTRLLNWISLKLKARTTDLKALQ